MGRRGFTTSDLVILLPLFSLRFFFLLPPRWARVNWDWLFLLLALPLLWRRPPKPWAAFGFAALTFLNAVLAGLRWELFVDFKNVYFAAKSVGTGLLPSVYSPRELLALPPEVLTAAGLKGPVLRFTYHPFVALALYPVFKILSLKEAYLLWEAAGFLALALWLWLLKKRLKPSEGIFALLVLAFLNPRMADVRVGQVNPVLVALVGAALLSPGALGALSLGASFLLKPTGILVSSEFLRKDERKRILILVLPVALATLSAFAMCPEALGGWVKTTLSIGKAPLGTPTLSLRDMLLNLGVPQGAALAAQSAYSLLILSAAVWIALRVPERSKKLPALAALSPLAMPMVFFFYFHMPLLAWAYWAARKDSLGWEDLGLWFLLTVPSATLNNLLKTHLPLSGLEAHLGALWLAWRLVKEPNGKDFSPEEPQRAPSG